jgi:hypothetical protein
MKEGKTRQRGTPGDDVHSVRPYVVTGGRVTAPDHLRMETLLELVGTGGADAHLSTEKRAILDQVGTAYLTIAEVSAHLGIPFGVTRVLVADLADSGLLVIHAAKTGDGAPGTATPEARELTLELLESVVDGLSVL